MSRLAEKIGRGILFLAQTFVLTIFLIAVFTGAVGLLLLPYMAFTKSDNALWLSFYPIWAAISIILWTVLNLAKEHDNE